MTVHPLIAQIFIDHGLLPASKSDVPREVDPRDPDHSRDDRQGRGTFFAYHNCYRCKDGSLPCVTKSGVCEYPHARDD